MVCKNSGPILTIFGHILPNKLSNAGAAEVAVF